MKEQKKYDAAIYADVIIGIKTESLEPQGFRRLNPTSHCP